MMIDWVTVLIPFIHDKPINGGHMVSIDADGVVDWDVEKRVTVEGSYGATIQIRSEHKDGSCSHIRLNGNPVKFIQGHNVWGSTDLHGLIVETLLRVLPVVAPEIKLTGMSVPLLAYYGKLTRIDITAMYDLGNSLRVLAWLRAAADSANLKHRGRGQFAGETLYWGKHSERWALKMYPKGQELKAHKPKKGISDHPHYLKSVTDFADRALRSELVIRGKELDKMGLSMVHNWGEGELERVYTSYLSGLEFSRNMVVSDDSLDTTKLPARLLGAVQLWQSGHDLRSVYTRATWYRYRGDILKLVGIDVSLPPPVARPERSNIVPLITILEAKPMGVPDWARGTPLYFEPQAYSFGQELKRINRST